MTQNNAELVAIENKIATITKSLERKKQERAEKEGRLSVVIEQIKSQFGIDPKDAPKKIKELEGDIVKLQNELNSKNEELLQMIGEFEGK